MFIWRDRGDRIQIQTMIEMAPTVTTVVTMARVQALDLPAEEGQALQPDSRQSDTVWSCSLTVDNLTQCDT